MKRKLLPLVLLLLAVFSIRAQERRQPHSTLKLPGLLSNYMVLQQATSVCLWGDAAPNSTVYLQSSWHNTPLQGEANENGRWEITLETPPATAIAQELTFWSENDTIRLNEILIGEVWFCSGQSNMEMPLRGFQNAPIAGANRTIATAGARPLVRYATIQRVGALTPQSFAVGGEWHPSTPSYAPEFGATAYYFAQQLSEVLQIPVGIINCSWGGSRVEGWLPKEILEGYSNIDLAKQEAYDYLLPMRMYNGMLHPSSHYTAKGFLWYQGESNVGHPDYAERLATMVSHWRSLWKNDQMPFYQVEIAPYEYGEGEQAAYLREQQLKACQLIPHSGLVSTNDLVAPYEKYEIHPREKKTIGERLAYLALSDTYGYSTLSSCGPIYERMEVEGSTAVLFFENAQGGFDTHGEAIGFEIAGQDRCFHPAQVKIEWQRNVLLISAPEVTKPVAVRYCFRNFQLGSVTNLFGLPVFPFRTDHW
ncbi:MAG: sialate O-acetylesterase [Phocaeicola sp.]